MRASRVEYRDERHGMSANEQAAEPSMEEILASIRKIISDDDENDASAAPAEAPAPEPVDADLVEIEQDEAFEQATQAELDDGVADVFEAPEPVEAEAFDDIDFDAIGEGDDADDDADDVLELDTSAIVEAPPIVEGPSAEDDDLDFGEGEFAASALPSSPAPSPQELSSGLMSSDANAAVSAAFGSLANTILSNDARTLEDLVSEMLRPMLKGWLDENLPPLVERLVREEIERVARGRR